MGKIYQNAVGVEIRVNAGKDISGATLLKLYVKKPGDVEVEWTASMYDTTTLVYTTVEGDLDKVGQYYLQAYVEWGTGSKHLGETAIFRIYAKYNQ